MIAILGAMASEIDALVEATAVEEHGSSRGFEYWRGRLAGRDCIVARCGMGKVSAASGVQRLIDRWGVTCVVVCGLAGGLGDGLRLGDVVVGESFMQHDLDASPIFPRYFVPGLDLSVFHASPALVASAVASAEAFLATGLETDIDAGTLRRMGIEQPVARSGLIVTGDQFVQEQTRLALRRDLPQALCVEMEGAAIAQVCHANDTPFVIVRVISDSADASAAVDFQRFVSEVAPAYTLGIVRQQLPRLP
ncbi:MAG TPA: 5'-methylthioadenosine/adenosylhomocysteine nucleosidase [Dehalococcoidia bacterium]|nr:5'-methylthioadenosine/adenosylhomocysteine nucleosidase [Dehalococcoidia bacterium]